MGTVLFFDLKNRTVPDFFLGLLLFAGCAHALPVHPPATALPAATTTPSPYKMAPPGKDLRTTPQFFLVDDFNDLAMKNRLGFPWEVESAKGAGRFRLRRQNQDSLRKRGGSLSFKGSLNPEVKIIFKSSLKGLDMSQAKGLALKCRIRTEAKVPFSGRLEMTLQDLRGQVQTVDFTLPCLSDPSSHGWKEAVLSRSFFAAIDWNKLAEIQFGLALPALPVRQAGGRQGAGQGPFRAEVGIDEIVFYSPGDVKFQSQKDNLFGFPAGVEALARLKALLAEPEDEKFLEEIARDTWKYFENAVDRKTSLPVDHLRVSEPQAVGSYTTPTNLAMYFLACVSAHELGIISSREAVQRMKKTMATLREMKRWEGFHYNFYDTGTLQVTRPYASAVDSGWLAAAWVVLRQAFPKELGEEASRFLKEIDFAKYYDPSVGQLRLGFDEALGNFSPYHYGLLATEARVASLVGIGKGDLPREHWWRIYRTPPRDWAWQSQAPEGREVEIEGETVFQGYYRYQGKKFVPSWGGSLFEFLMPALVLKEKELAPQSLGLNNRVATEIQIDYALNRQGYPIWGISPASTSSGRLWRYGEYGVKYLGVKGYRDEGIIAPYAAFLALDAHPQHAVDNLRKMLELYPVYGEYGFYDSINIRNGRVNAQYLALDQGMILAAIANFLRKGTIQAYFHQDEIGKKAEALFSKEQWFQ